MSRKHSTVAYTERPCPNRDLKGPCHVFTGYLTKKGYGTVNRTISGKKRTVRVHRLIWEKANGPIPSNLVIDHQCRVRSCCNVDHLRLVTKRVNALENNEGLAARNAKKTHCPQGHPYDELNTRLEYRGRRICKACEKIRKSPAKRRGWYLLKKQKKEG